MAAKLSLQSNLEFTASKLSRVHWSIPNNVVAMIVATFVSVKPVFH